MSKFSIKARIYWMCFVCAWRCQSRRGMKQHLKDQHQIGFNQVKFLKPK